jgi:hypothetical protein
LHCQRTPLQIARTADREHHHQNKQGEVSLVSKKIFDGFEDAFHANFSKMVPAPRVAGDNPKAY